LILCIIPCESPQGREEGDKDGNYFNAQKTERLPYFLFTAKRGAKGPFR